MHLHGGGVEVNRRTGSFGCVADSDSSLTIAAENEMSSFESSRCRCRRRRPNERHGLTELTPLQARSRPADDAGAMRLIVKPSKNTLARVSVNCCLPPRQSVGRRDFIQPAITASSDRRATHGSVC